MALIKGRVSRVIKEAFEVIGLDVYRMSKSPRRTMLGLRDRSFRSIIDVGANTGQFAKSISAFFPGARLFCFEPLEKPYRELARWADDERKSFVQIFNVALGDHEGEVEMFQHLDHTPSSSILKTTELNSILYPFTRNQSSVKVRMMRLDQALKPFLPLEPETLIKLDAQGYERYVIRGGVETFRRASACILEVNLSELYEGQSSFTDLVNALGDFGYVYAGNLEQQYAEDGQVIYADAVFCRSMRQEAEKS